MIYEISAIMYILFTIFLYIAKIEEIVYKKFGGKKISELKNNKTFICYSIFIFFISFFSWFITIGFMLWTVTKGIYIAKIYAIIFVIYIIFCILIGKQKEKVPKKSSLFLKIMRHIFFICEIGITLYALWAVV